MLKRILCWFFTFIVILAISGTAMARDTYLDLNYNCSKYGAYYANNLTSDPYGFVRCQCTSYAAKKMNEHKVKLHNTKYKVPTRNYRKWGNAANWYYVAKEAGISTGKTPKKRDIAWWSSSSRPKYGHVAYVEKVNSDGSITISDYNYKKYSYSTATLKKGSKSWPNGFIHFGAK